MPQGPPAPPPCRYCPQPPRHAAPGAHSHSVEPHPPMCTAGRRACMSASRATCGSVGVHSQPRRCVVDGARLSFIFIAATCMCPLLLESAHVTDGHVGSIHFGAGHRLRGRLVDHVGCCILRCSPYMSVPTSQSSNKISFSAIVCTTKLPIDWHSTPVVKVKVSFQGSGVEGVQADSYRRP